MDKIYIVSLKTISQESAKNQSAKIKRYNFCQQEQKLRSLRYPF